MIEVRRAFGRFISPLFDWVMWRDMLSLLLIIGGFVCLVMQFPTAFKWLWLGLLYIKWLIAAIVLFIIGFKLSNS